MNLALRELKVLNASHTVQLSCISAIDSLVTAEVPQKDNFSLGEALQSYYPLLELVFTYLDKSSLQIACRTSSIWKDLATKELNKRIWPTWITFARCGALTCSVGFNHNNVSFGIFAYNPSLVQLNKTLCVHSSLDETNMSVTEYLDTITETQLQYCVIACASLLPIAPSSRVNRCAIDTAFQGLFIPHIPHVQTYMFEAFPKSVNRLWDEVTPKLQVKCCIIFCSQPRFVEPFLSGLLKDQKPESLALGGGIIHSKKSLKMPEGESLKESEIFCITFLQGDDTESNFKTYSVVILNETEDEAGFLKELLKFKEQVVLHKYGIIFRFCCKAKTWRTEESDIIKTHFPDFILFGMDVNGEIGWNTCETFAQVTPKLKRKKGLPQCVYGWSTVLVLITWNK
ncbi:hypothetical protein RI129_010923 [Pyrocoelia pectoralis]|uniref:F-box domain-containing protein n=1 Tax=Pyrocoelia pectoralis TaxID=417401 RepID=A0AAN7ZE44_9COLE